MNEEKRNCYQCTKQETCQLSIDLDTVQRHHGWMLTSECVAAFAEIAVACTEFDSREDMFTKTIKNMGDIERGNLFGSLAKVFCLSCGRRNDANVDALKCSCPTGRKNTEVNP